MTEPIEDSWHRARAAMEEWPDTLSEIYQGIVSDDTNRIFPMASAMGKMASANGDIAVLCGDEPSSRQNLAYVNKHVTCSLSDSASIGEAKERLRLAHALLTYVVTDVIEKVKAEEQVSADELVTAEDQANDEQHVNADEHMLARATICRRPPICRE